MSAIKGSINVSKITKSRLIQGKKGQWLGIVLIPTPESEYGDYMIKESVTFEDHQKGIQGAILGNAKIIIKKEVEGAPADLPF